MTTAQDVRRNLISQIVYELPMLSAVEQSAVLEVIAFIRGKAGVVCTVGQSTLLIEAEPVRES